MTFKHSIVLGITVSSLASTALTDVKIGSIGGLSSDTSLSTLCGAEIAIEEVNAAGDMSGEKFVLVGVDTDGDVTEGVKAYEYLAETGEVDFIISGSIDDMNPDWLSGMQELQIPTLDTWTSCIGITDVVIEDPEAMAPYFTNIAPNEVLATLYIDFGADVLKKETGWDSAVILAEDTVFDEAIAGLVTKALGPIAGIETKEIIAYNIGTVDFAPLFSKAQVSGAGFIYQANSMNPQAISSQYVKLRVPVAMAGVNVPAPSLEYWEDTGGAGGGIPTLSPIPPVGFELDPESQRLVDTYRTKYGSRPKMPHFNGFDAYWGLEQAVVAAGTAGGFGDAKAWFTEMKKRDITLKRDDRTRSRYAFWGDDEVEEVTGRTYPHNARFDLTAPYDGTQPSVAIIQQKEDGEVDVVHPPEYATIKFTVSSWIK